MGLFVNQEDEKREKDLDGNAFIFEEMKFIELGDALGRSEFK